MRAACRRSSIDAVATSAIRDAENAEDFLARARERSRLPIRVLSREAEARYGYLAAVNSTTLGDGCVLDLGGGSLQLVRVADRLAPDRLVARGDGADERALPARQRAGEAPPASGAARARRRASSRRRLGWRRQPAAAGGSWASAERCETSPRPPSAPLVCRRSACRGCCFGAMRWTSSWRAWRRCRPPSARACRGSSRRAPI